jgi:hypothetical protein
MTETKQWMGLHNHDRHFYSPGYGDRCGKCWYCSPETPCYCCLQAEVEALRAQVQRVRELRDRFRDHEKWASYRNVGTLLTRALDGDA